MFMRRLAGFEGNSARFNRIEDENPSSREFWFVGESWKNGISDILMLLEDRIEEKHSSDSFSGVSIGKLLNFTQFVSHLYTIINHKMNPQVFQNSPIPNLNSAKNFQTLLEGLLSNSLNTRAECLNFFDQLKVAHLPFLLESLIEILFHLQDSQTKTLTLILLRQLFTSNSPQYFWTLIPIHTRQQLIQSLTIYSKSESSLSTLKHLSDFLLQFNSSIYSFSKKIVHEFLELAMEFSSKEDSSASFGLYLLSGYFPYFNEYFYIDKETLFKVFEKSLKSQNFEVNSAAIKTFAALVFSFENSQAMYFGQLLKDLLKAVLKVKSEENIEKITDSAEAEPFFYYRKFNLCLSFCKAIIKTQETAGVKFCVCKLICNICANSECKLEEIKESVKIVQEFLDGQSLIMPDSVEVDYLDLGSELIAEVISSHLDYLNEFVSGICENIILGGLKAYILGMLQLEKIIKCIKNEVSKISELLIQTNDNYGLWLTLKCIGNMWKLSKYSILNISNLLSINLNALSHASEIIQVQAYKSLNYFIERGSKSVILKYSQSIKSHLFASIRIRNHVEPLQLLHKVLKRFKDSIVFHDIPEALIKILDKFNYQAVLMCLADLKTFYPVENLVNEIIISLNLLNCPLDQNLINTWQILLKHFPANISIYIDQLFLPIISLVTDSLNSGYAIPDVYLQSLIYFSGNKLCYKFLPQVNWIVVKLFEHPDENVQMMASQLSVTMLKTMNLCKDPSTLYLAKIYTKSIWKSFILHSQSYHKLEQLEALKSLIETFNDSVLTESEADWLINSLFTCMKNSSGFEIMVEECRFAAFLYRKHPSLPKSLLEISTDVLTGYLQAASEEEKFIILTILCEFIDNCGTNIGPRLEKIFDIFLVYAEYVDEKIREQGVKGLGCYSIVVNSSEYTDKVHRVLGILEKCIKNEKVFNYRYYERCRNSAILTVGVILMHHAACLDVKTVIQEWIWLLPIQGDQDKEHKSESILTHLLKKHSFSLGNLGEKNLSHIKNILKESYFIEISTSIDCTHLN